MMDPYGLFAAALLIGQVAFNAYVAINSPLMVKSYGQTSAKTEEDMKRGSLWWGMISTITFAVLYGVIAILVVFVKNSVSLDNALVTILVLAMLTSIGVASYLYAVLTPGVVANLTESESQIKQYNIPNNPGGDWSRFFDSYRIVMTYPAHAAVSAAVVAFISSILIYYRRYQTPVVSAIVGGLRKMRR